MKQIKKLALLFLIIGALFACNTAVDDTGSIELSIDNNVAKMIGPPISMEAVEYEITVTGPTPSVTVVTESAVISGLMPGDYDITVVGKNAAGDAIGEGSALAVAVAIGNTVQVDISVTEYIAIKGSLSGIVEWEPDILADPDVTGYLKDSAGVQTDLTFLVSTVDCDAPMMQGDLDVGYYTMVNQLWDGADLSAGFAEIVRIVSNRETTYTKTLYANQCYGYMEILISADLNDPLVLDFDVPLEPLDLYAGESKTFSLTSVDEAGYTATWYLDGEQVAFDVDSYSVDSSVYLWDTTHRLDCLVFSADGSRANSAGWVFDVIEEQPELPVIVTFDCSVAGNYLLDLYAIVDGETINIDGTGQAVAGRNEITVTDIVPGEYQIAAVGPSTGGFVYFDPDTGGTTTTAPTTTIVIPNFTFAEFYLGNL